MPPIPFPVSSSPGRLNGEGEGRLENIMAERDGETIYWRRPPGLAVAAAMGHSTPRGMIDLAGTVYAAYQNAIVLLAPGATSASATLALGGPVAGAVGTDGVTWARNNRVTAGVSTPDLVMVRSGGGAFLIHPDYPEVYPDADLPATVNSVDGLGGYLLYTVPDGRMFATGPNTTDINPLSFATAEASSDGLLRGFVASGRFHAMGSATIEPWINVGNTPFPLQRATSIIPVGLLTTMAVAGAGEGWDRNPFFVAHDGTVRELTGYTTRVVSTPAVERFIADSTVSTLEASVYTSRGRAIWSLSSDVGTWEFDVTAGAWHERKSDGQVRWRASRSVKSNGRWLVGDIASQQILAVQDGLRTEAGAPMVALIESGPSKAYPARIQIPQAFFDFTPAAATVAVSWSLEGGTDWSVPVNLSLADARNGVTLNNLGLASHHGLRVRLTIADDVDFSFMGGSVPAPEVRPG